MVDWLSHLLHIQDKEDSFVKLRCALVSNTGKLQGLDNGAPHKGYDLRYTQSQGFSYKKRTLE